MARVIKAGAGAQTARPARPATKVLAQADVKKVIEKELYFAKQEAEELLRRTEEERKEILAAGKQRAAQVREQAMVMGASQAFAAAAEEALSAFRARADRYADAADDIRALAVEIATKLLGTAPDLGPADVERILAGGLFKLRAKRKVRVLVRAGRKASLAVERPNLMKAVAAQPDVLLDEAADIGTGFARVVTEVGGALCAEDSAMEALAQAVNVKEAPRQVSASFAGAKEGGGAAGARVKTNAFDDPQRTGEVSAGYDDDVSEIVSRPGSIDEEEVPSLPDLEALPDASYEEDDDETRALPRAVLSRERKNQAELPRSVTTPRPSSAPAAPTRVQAGNRVAATRVLPIDARDALREKAMRGPARPDLGADDDDDLDLFTDSRPAQRR